MPIGDYYLRSISEEVRFGVVLLFTVNGGSLRVGLNRRLLCSNGLRYNREAIGTFNLPSYSKVDTVVETRGLSSGEWLLRCSNSENTELFKKQSDEEKTSTDQDEDIKVSTYNSDEETTSSEDEAMDIPEPMDTDSTSIWKKKNRAR
ncbi:hypothetical protein Gotur_003128 [Gossypium turneri]